MAHLYKPVAVKPIPQRAVIRTINGQPHACWTNRKSRKVEALVITGNKCRVVSPIWWIEYTTATGERDRRAGFADRSATMELAVQLERASRDVKAGRKAPRSEAPQHLADHLPAFRQSLEAKGNTPGHVESVIHNVTAVVINLNLTTLASVNCERITNWLLTERQRCRWSDANVNRYLQFLRQFGRWLLKTDRVEHNPFDRLASIRVGGGASRERRRLTDDELHRLIAAAQTSSKPIYSLDGPDRARLYLLAAYTGFRLGTLARLQPDAFTWSVDSLFPEALTASRRIVKNRKGHTVPLHPTVGRELADWLRSRPRGRPIFPAGYWSRRAADLVAHDLQTARTQWIDEATTADDRTQREASDTLCTLNTAGQVFDFHAFRVQFVSGLALAGVPLTAAQQLADHSTPILTANIYTRWGPKELASEVAKLAGIPTKKSELKREVQSRRKRQSRSES